MELEKNGFDPENQSSTNNLENINFSEPSLTRTGDEIPFSSINTKDRNKRVVELEEKKGIYLPYISKDLPIEDNHQFKGNIEYYFGMAQIPMGLAGPINITGNYANGSFKVPMATTEGALVASYNRGAKASAMSGGITSRCIEEGVQRCPLFFFDTIDQSIAFRNWINLQWEVFNKITSENSRFAKLTEVKSHIESNSVQLTFKFTTGDAAGQNMVTICTSAICDYISNHCPIDIFRWYLESNFSGDKKATAINMQGVRGKKVTAEVVVPKKVVERVLRSTPEKMSHYVIHASIAALQNGAIGVHGHYANGLAALFLAAGQDVACVAEATNGITKFLLTEEGDLHACVTLPNLIVGTVGGGTGLPTQNECLKILDCVGPGNAQKFAEICGALVLCGELSIIAALSDGHFSRAHQVMRQK